MWAPAPGWHWPLPGKAGAPEVFLGGVGSAWAGLWAGVGGLSRCRLRFYELETAAESRAGWPGLVPPPRAPVGVQAGWFSKASREVSPEE